MFYSRLLAKKNKFQSDYVGEDIVNLLDTSFQLPQNFMVKTMIVDEEYTARPDLLAFDIYGDELYADILCKINGISNPYELNGGDVIIVPELAYIEDFIVTPNKAWKENGSIETGSGSNLFIQQLADGMNNIEKVNSPQPKSRSEKRKPNEAVIGDSRFNIDPISKIVIY